MHHVGVAEQVVHVAQDLLVGAHQEEAEVVGLVRLERVQLERALDVAQVDEAVHLAVRVAGDVGEDRAARRLLVVAVQRQHREELVDGPAVGQRLEQREVEEVRVRHVPLEVGEVVGHVVQRARDAQDLLAGAPEVVLDAGALLHRDLADVEEHHGLVADLERVVVALLVVLGRDVLVHRVEVVHQLVLFLGRLPGQAFLGEVGGAEHLRHQHRVVRRQGAARLGDDRRLRDARFGAGLLQVVHDVVGVLLHGVVHRRLEVGRAAVVVDAQAAAAVEVLDGAAHAVQAHQRVGRLAQRVLQRADLGDLRAEVEVQQLDAVRHALALHALDHHHHLARGEAELGAVAAGLLPAAGALAGQLAAHADRRADVEAARHGDDRLDLRVLLDHEDRRDAELRGEERHLDVLLVLVPVADHQARVAGEQRDDRDQLGLGADLEAHVVVLAFREQRLDDVPLLVDLDREHAAVGGLVAELLAGVVEGLVHRAHARPQDAVEAQQDRRVHAAAQDLPQQLVHVDAGAVGAVGAFRAHFDVARFVDAEESAAPFLDVVEIVAVRVGPLGHRRR